MIWCNRKGDIMYEQTLVTASVVLILRLGTCLVDSATNGVAWIQA